MQLPLIICVAPTGPRLTKRDHAKLPITPSEFGETAKSVVEAGASMIHLHVRSPSGGHSLDAETYRKAISAIRSAVNDNLIVQITTEAGGIFDRFQQMSVVREVRPEAVSISLREIIPNQGVETEAAQFLHWLPTENIHPQYIFYDRTDLARFRDFRQRGVIPEENIFCLLVLGRRNGVAGLEPNDLEEWQKYAATDLQWMVCGFGPAELDYAGRAAELGGHCRVGFEQGLLLSDGSIAPDNAALVSQVNQHTARFGRLTMNANEARELLQITPNK